jgi:DNA-binding transcriptional MocR family regulator
MLYCPIAHAIERGARLPPRRSLADHLKVSVGTVTMAYLEAGQ